LYSDKCGLVLACYLVTEFSIQYVCRSTYVNKEAIYAVNIRFFICVMYTKTMVVNCTTTRV